MADVFLRLPTSDRREPLGLQLGQSAQEQLEFLLDDRQAPSLVISALPPMNILGRLKYWKTQGNIGISRYVIVRKQPVADNGDIAVVAIENR